MPDIKAIQAEILARLTEVQELLAPLRAEAEQLTRMAATFSTPNLRPAAKAARPARPTAAPSVRRGLAAPGGGRAQQAVEKIAEQPGITVAELARAMGISPNYLYRVLPRLERDGRIIRQGKGYHADVNLTASTNGQPEGG